MRDVPGFRSAGHNIINEDEAEHSNVLPCPGLQLYHSEFGGVQGEAWKDLGVASFLRHISVLQDCDWFRTKTA